MPIASVLQRFVDDELARAPSMIERALAGTQRLLSSGRDSGLRASERSLRLELVDALQGQSKHYQLAFVQALRMQVADLLQDSHGELPVGPLALPGGLELMDESRVDVDIEISRAMQLIDTTAEWELRELQTFTSTLVGQSHVSAESNPLRPIAYATALWEAACVVSPTQAQRATLLRVSSGVIAGLLKTAWAAACTRLQSQGVEPGIYRTMLVVAPTVGQRSGLTPPADAGQSGALAALLASMPGGSDELKLGIGGAGSMAGSAAGTSGRSAGHGGMSAGFERALARFDERLRHLPPSEPAATGASAGRLSTQRGALLARAAAPIERQIIELLSRLFDAMLSDPQLQTAFRAVLARLQASALRVALHEPDMLESPSHAVWQFFDRLGEVSAGHPRAGDPRGSALWRCAHSLAEELARAKAPDGALYRRALQRLDMFGSEQVQAQLGTAEPSVAALCLAERREVLEKHLALRLVDQMVPLRTSPSIRRFVTGTWAKVLAESMIRHGEQHETTRGYIKLVDQLLWSVQLPDHPQSRQRLVSLLPGMLQRLRAGMALVALAPAEQSVVLDELMAVHTEALRPGAHGGQGLTADEIVQRMRDEVLPQTTGPMAFSDSVIDISSMETVPADLLSGQAMDEPAEAPGKRIDALRPGQRLRLFVRGRWAKVQLLWRSDQLLFYLFAGESPGHTHSVTRRALERLASAGLLQPLESRSLVQRALDSLVREQTRPGA